MRADPPHRHRWSVTDFFIVEDRPMMRQSCACGERRAIPAWDRTWDPGAAATGGPTSGHDTVREEL